jgi:sugar transferase (PEP-CTERM system associated)
MLELFRSPRRAIVWFVEASLLALLGVSATGVMLGWAHALGGGHVLRVLLVAVVAQASMYYHGLYGPQPVRTPALMVGLLRALVLAGVVLGLVYRYLLPPLPVGRGVMVAALGGAVVVLPAFRTAFARVAASPLLVRNAIVLGGGVLGRECAALIAADHGTGLRLAGVLVQEGEGTIPGVPVLGRYADVARVCAAHRVDRVVVATPERRGTLPVLDLLDLKLGGVAIEEGIDFYERATGKVFVSALSPGDLVFARGYEIRRGALAVKRAFDVAAAALGLLLGLPILAAAALAIKLDSPGPAFYAQERAGALGRCFRIFKLRSMRTDAEARGAVWAVEDDPRVTRVGRFLRRTRIDELPQLWNVLAGDMSLVGPRPERPVFVTRLEQEIPFFARRLCLKPGVTGHAQVRCRYGASLDDAREKLAYDLYYIKRFSLWFDLSILIDTVKVVLLRIGSR